MTLWFAENNLSPAPAKQGMTVDGLGARAAGVDVTQSSGKATAWKNRGSDAGDWAAPSGMEPTYSATGLAVPAGAQPAVVFSGGQLLDALMSLNGNAVTIYAVLSLVSGNNGKRAISLNKNTADFSDSQCAAILKSSSNTSGVAEIERNGLIVTGADPITSPCIVRVDFDGTNAHVAVNGGTPVTAAASGLLAPTHMMLGGYYYGSGNNPVDLWSGPISEVIALYYTPTTDQDQRIVGSLAWKYLLQTSNGGVLASSYPYATAAPMTGGIIIPRRRPLILMAS
ncbi:hypothetical protein [Methylobacterium sp. SI9]|uniref:hypothetical protein n=1 Tax=Methylobacterium guangdongense TaxID=3138811 RepID=UPI00313C2048